MTITHSQALNLLHNKMQSQNLRRHCCCVQAVMEELARKFKNQNSKIKINEEINIAKWGILGLLHDGDYEVTKDNRERHTIQMIEWLQEMGETDEELIKALKSHNYTHTGNNPPDTLMEWSLFCCDELTGFIVAVTLVRPEKKLSAVTVENILKKFPEKEFAKGVKREDIEMCEEKLGIPLNEFIGISLNAMQKVSDKIGL